MLSTKKAPTDPEFEEIWENIIDNSHEAILSKNWQRGYDGLIDMLETMLKEDKSCKYLANLHLS